jgi:lysylphosphatidylglycerol synthetase-like protein (DUF2156 family)
VALFGAFCWLALLLARGREHEDWQDGGRLAWSLTILCLVAFIARGIFLGRPVTVGHALAAAGAVAAGLGAHLMSSVALGDVLVTASGWVLMLPTSARAQPDALPRIWSLVERTHGDPLAPFAMHRLKSYHFTADGRAALAYRTVLGFAVVSGDPIGDAHRFRELVGDFVAMCHSRGWRIAVLGCGEHRLGLWLDARVIGQTLRAVPIGRDVVIDAAHFHLTGRRFRNLRQAVKRTRNAGLTTTVVSEADLDGRLRAELTDVVRASPKGAHTERGFAMMLDGTLRADCPGIELVIARDRHGRVQGFQRYAVAGAGSDVSLDIPWRRRDAPNGVDERMTVDMIGWANAHGGHRVSLAFAPFPEIFQARDGGPLQRLVRVLIHLGDTLIRLESLYRYLRKFDALGRRRYVLVSFRHLMPVLCALLFLEFAPRRRRL